MANDGKAISAAYGRAGNDFLAHSLEGMFRELRTPEDVALHNVIQRDVMLMVGDSAVKFYRVLGNLLETKVERKARRSFRDVVAEAILDVAKG